MDNFVSFKRFTSIPANIAEHGATVEEYKLTQGRPDGNPVLSPMANPAVSEARLALAPTGSDSLRLSTPALPVANPYEGPKRTLVLSRNAAVKLGGQVIGDLQQLVGSGTVVTDELQDRMLDSLQRVAGLREFVIHLNGMSDFIVASTLSASKG